MLSCRSCLAKISPALLGISRLSGPTSNAREQTYVKSCKFGRRETSEDFLYTLVRWRESEAEHVESYCFEDSDSAIARLRLNVLGSSICAEVIAVESCLLEIRGHGSSWEL